MNGRIKKDEAPNRTLPIIGKIKVGGKATNTAGKEYPVSYDYFVADGKYAELFNKAFSAKPNKIQIVFMSDNVEEVCNERFECWSDKGRKLAYGDGEHFFLFDEAKKEYSIAADKDKAVAYAKDKNGKWSAILTIRFLIPAIKGVMGVWELSTKGAKSSIENVRNTFDSVMSTAKRVRGIPFDLLISKHTSKKPGVTSVYPVLTLVPNLSQESMLILSEFAGSQQFDRIGVLTDDNIWEAEKPLQITQRSEGQD